MLRTEDCRAGVILASDSRQSASAVSLSQGEPWSADADGITVGTGSPRPVTCSGAEMTFGNAKYFRPQGWLVTAIEKLVR